MEQETPQVSATAGKRWMKLDWDEYYPFYTLNDDDQAYAINVELHEEVIDWIEEVQTNMDEVQRYLNELRSEYRDKERSRGH